MHAAPHRAGDVHKILFQEDPAVVEALLPQVLVGIKANRVALHKREFG